MTWLFIFAFPFSDDFKPLFKTAASEFSHHEIVKPVIYKGDKQLLSTKDKVIQCTGILNLYLFSSIHVMIVDHLNQPWSLSNTRTNTEKIC